MSRRLLRGLGRRLLTWSGAVASAFPPGHFYSPIVDPGAVERTRVWPYRPDVLGIDFNDASHVRILRDEFPRFMPEFDYPQTLDVAPTLSSFFRDNAQFAMLDPPALFVLLRAWKPRRIIEVGSGFSSLLMADVNARFLGHEVTITCVDPFPRRSCGRASTASPAWSSVACRSCLWSISPTCRRVTCCSSIRRTSPRPTATSIFFFSRFSPGLASGVLIHLHDIFLPHDYPPDWVLGENRSWNEQYLLRALLMHSSGFEVLFGCSYAFWRYPELVIAALANADGAAYGGGSFWLRRL